MSRYRKVEVRTYGDEKFRKLSPIRPCGQGLWFYLITGPHTTAVPGLFRAGRAAIAEELGWPPEAFNHAFQEVLDQGMAKADFENRVVWLPNAIKHNKPASPNVVTSWAAELDLIPECALKSEAIKAIEEFLNLLGTSYAQAFTAMKKGSEKPLPRPSRKPSSKATANQEQEQEQDQDQDKKTTLALTACAVHAPVFITLPLNDGTEFPISEVQIDQWNELYPAVDVPQQLRNMKGWLSANPTKRKTKRGILKFIHFWLSRAQDSQRSNANGETRRSGANDRVRANQEAIRRAAERRGIFDLSRAGDADGGGIPASGIRRITGDSSKGIRDSRDPLWTVQGEECPATAARDSRPEILSPSKSAR